MPFTNAGASAPQNRLASLDGLVDRSLRWDRLVPRQLVGIEQLDQADPQDRALERRDPVQRPALRVLADQLVELGLMLADEAPPARA